MTMKCKICSHPDRKEIDRAIVACETEESIAKRYDFSDSAVHNHKKNGHVNKYMIAAKERELVKHGKTLLDKLDYSIDLSIQAMNKAMSEDIRAYGSCAGALAKLMELQAKIKGLKSDDDTPGIDRAIEKMKERRDNGK